MRMVPAAALRGLAAADWPAASRSSFILRKASCGMTHSPRISKASGRPAAASFAGLKASGMDLMVRTFDVTSSPVVPSPRVRPRMSLPSA